MQLGGVSIHGSAKHDFSVVRKSFGAYLGNGAQNRAIAHGLGVTPSLVMVQQFDSPRNMCFSVQDTNFVAVIAGAATESLTVTAKDATNFYVGGVSGALLNVNLDDYDWVAFG